MLPMSDGYQRPEKRGGLGPSREPAGVPGRNNRLYSVWLPVVRVGSRSGPTSCIRAGSRGVGGSAVGSTTPWPSVGHARSRQRNGVSCASWLQRRSAPVRRCRSGAQLPADVLCISRGHLTPRYASGVTQVVPTIDALRARRQVILAAARRRHASRIRIFGSVARGDAGASSDVDFLVDFDADASLLDQVGLTQDLEALLGIPVDVISSGGLRPRHRRIRDEAIDL